MNDNSSFQRLQLKFGDGDVQDNVMRVQNYGFASHPPDGSEALVLFQGGMKENPIAISVDHRQARLKELKVGEVALYNDLEVSSKIVLKNNGGIQIEGNGQNLIEVLKAFLDAVTDMKITAPSGGGLCTLIQPSFSEISGRLEKLN
jgi:phage gp45-like